MGGSTSSTSNQTYDSSIINKSDIEIVNKQITDITSNTMMENASSCSASASQRQSFDMHGTRIAGNLNIRGITQDQTQNVDFSCVNISQVSGTVGNEVLAKMMTNLDSKFDASLLDKLNSTANTDNNTGFGGGIGANTSSNSNINYKSTTVNENRKKIENVVKNSISNNMNLKSVQECTMNSMQNQEIDFSNMDVDGNANIGEISQKQVLNLVAKCVNQSKMGSNITNQIVNDLGLTVKEDTSIKKEADLASSATTKNVATGPIQDLGNAIGSIFGGIFGGLSKMILIPILVVIVCCCLCCCALLVFMMMGSGGGQKGGKLAQFNTIQDTTNSISSMLSRSDTIYTALIK